MMAGCLALGPGVAASAWPKHGEPEIMSIGEPPVTKLVTTEEFLELLDDDIDRDLIDGVVRVWGDGMTLRHPVHGESEISIGHELRVWLATLPGPKGKVVGAETRFRLRRNPDSFVGVDVAYVSPEMAAAHDRKRKYFDGPPRLAVEILSPSDKHEKVVEKVERYLEAGSVVWVVDADFRTVAVHRPGEPPVAFNDRQELDAGPYLPGFRVRVARFFDA